ncbi:DHS-16 protein [Aphelenchoides avenae]|nr:DHS-16 protein [Aphelenchus avenae]
MAARVNKVWNRLPTELKEEYGEEYREKLIHERCDGIERFASHNLDYVVDNYLHAITARWPRLRYHCGWDALLVWIPMSTLLPTTLEDFVLRKLNGTYRVPAALQKKQKN